MNAKRNIVIITGTLFLITLSVNIEMPLFKTYAENESFGIGMVVLAFVSYIIGLLPTTIFLGGLSDKIGKKKVLIIALFLSTISVTIISTLPNFYVLLVSRVLMGCSVALSITTSSSFLSDKFIKNKQENSSNIVALTTSLGFGGGALFTGMVLLYNFSIVPLSYIVVIGLSIIWLFVISTIAESDFDKKKRMIRLPLVPKSALKYNISIALFWAVTGIVISIIPSQIAKFNLGNWSGTSLFLINLSGVLCLPLARKYSVEKSMNIAYVLLPVGFSILTYGSIYGKLPFLLIGCSIVGVVSYGFGYFGSLTGVSSINPSEKARIVAGYLMFAYLGVSIPSIVIGLTSQKYGIEHSLVIYLFITIVAAVTLLILAQLKEKRYKTESEMILTVE